MAQIVWSQKATSQLKEIVTYIKKDSAFQANRVASRIVQSTAKLRQFPEFGERVPEFSGTNLREIHVFSYRIIYRFPVGSNKVRIVGIAHGMRMLTDDLLDLS